MSERILLGLLLVALCALPVAMFLYLRTAYRSGGWHGVKRASLLVVVAGLSFAVFRLWEYLESGLFGRMMERRFDVAAAAFALWWLGHRALKTWTSETNDHN
ncbi:MAG TPA: hypothetical protein VMT28_02520 [Terriglobales bacterium]|nr:hypothetical protein [Terriglobales bacterium]